MTEIGNFFIPEDFEEFFEENKRGLILLVRAFRNLCDIISNEQKQTKELPHGTIVYMKQRSTFQEKIMQFKNKFYQLYPSIYFEFTNLFLRDQKLTQILKQNSIKSEIAGFILNLNFDESAQVNEISIDIKGFYEILIALLDWYTVLSFFFIIEENKKSLSLSKILNDSYEEPEENKKVMSEINRLWHIFRRQFKDFLFLISKYNSTVTTTPELPNNLINFINIIEFDES